jgi:hypothetical protein
MNRRPLITRLLLAIYVLSSLHQDGLVSMLALDGVTATAVLITWRAT